MHDISVFGDASPSDSGGLCVRRPLRFRSNINRFGRGLLRGDAFVVVDSCNCLGSGWGDPSLGRGRGQGRGLAASWRGLRGRVGRDRPSGTQSSQLRRRRRGRRCGDSAEVERKIEYVRLQLDRRRKESWKPKSRLTHRLHRVAAPAAPGFRLPFGRQRGTAQSPLLNEIAHCIHCLHRMATPVRQQKAATWQKLRLVLPRALHGRHLWPRTGASPRRACCS